jgi:beta-catenin-like protein 1
VVCEGVEALIELLDHPNPDIAIESVILLAEITEEDNNTAISKVVQILINNEVWNFITRLVTKFDDSIDEERKSISHCLKLLENLLEEEPLNMSNKLMHIDTLIDWFIIFITNSNPSSENHLQAAEVLFTIVQNCHEEYKVKFAKVLNGMERLLNILNSYRKKTLELEEEHESLVNIIDTICSLLILPECQDLFRHL